LYRWWYILKTKLRGGSIVAPSLHRRRMPNGN
jgi:hypothetical protein